MTLYALSRLPYTDVAAGRWANAVSHATEAVSLGEETAQPVLADSPRTWLLLLALRQDEAAFDSLAAQLAAVMARKPAGVLDVLLRDTIRWLTASTRSPNPPPRSTISRRSATT